MSDEHRRGLEEAVQEVERFTTANLRRVDVLARLRALIVPDETHEQRWRRLGYEVYWSDEDRQYVIRYHTIRANIAGVDAWISEHPAA